MKGVKALTLLTICVTSLALADDFKTVNGKEYKNATVSRVEPDGIVLITKTGISKVYFVELPKDVQERFHYVDPAKAAAERDAAEIEERTRRERDAEAILKEAEERFEADETRAAYKSRGDVKGDLSGQIFVATRGGQNVKLGAVHVSLFARDAIDALVAGLTAFAHAKIGQLNIAAAEAEVAQAEVGEKQAEAEEEQAEAIEKSISGVRAPMNPPDAKEAVNRASEAVSVARARRDSLLRARSYYYSVPFYFGYLHSPIQTVETAGEGRFMVPVPRRGEFVIAAQAERTVGKDTESYYWLQPVSLHGQQQAVQNLSNNNLTIATGMSSLINTQD